MITIFNRKELATTFSIERQAEIRNRLARHHIDYFIKIVNRDKSNTSGGRIRTMENQTSVEYIFYVKKDKLERAQYVIQAD